MIVALLKFALLICIIFLVEVFVLGAALVGLVYSRGGVFLSTRFLVCLCSVLLTIALFVAFKLTPSIGNAGKEIPWFALHKH